MAMLQALCLYMKGVVVQLTGQLESHKEGHNSGLDVHISNCALDSAHAQSSSTLNSGVSVELCEDPAAIKEHGHSGLDVHISSCALDSVHAQLTTTLNSGVSIDLREDPAAFKEHGHFLGDGCDISLRRSELSTDGKSSLNGINSISGTLQDAPDRATDGYKEGSRPVRMSNQLKQ